MWSKGVLAVLLAAGGVGVGSTPAAAAEMCRGIEATIVGTKGSDTILGTGGPDVIAALGGNDTISGRGGDDVICGGAGSDVIDGNAGADWIDGGDGGDDVGGGVGADTIVGGAGPDVLDGNGGPDVVDGGAADDVIGGGAGDDVLDGDAGTDTISGAADNDILGGGPGPDTLNGNQGDDALDGDEGSNTLDGGLGVDLCEIGAAGTSSRCEGRLARVLVEPTFGLETTEAGGVATFTVALAHQPYSDVTISVSTSDTSEGVASTNLIRFTTLNWDVPQTVAVTGRNDTTVDGDIAYTIRLATARGGGYHTVDPSDVGVTNVDDDGAPPTGSLGDRVWNDLNENGLQDAGEPGIAGVAVTLTPDDGSPPLATTSVGDGTYRFDGVPVGAHKIEFATPDGMVPTTRDAGGDDEVDSDVGVDLPRLLLDVAAGVTDLSVDAGFYVPVDRVVTVTPVDGLVTGEDGTTATFEVALSAAPYGQVTIPVESDDETEGVTDVHRIDFLPGDWAPRTVTITGADDTALDGDVEYSIQLSPAAGGGYEDVDPDDVSVTNLDDEVAPSSISGRVWREFALDDVRGADEDPIAGREVELVRTGQTLPTATTATDDDGRYRFDDVAPGEYSVRVRVSINERAVATGVGDDPTVDSDIRSDGSTERFVVEQGDDVEHLDAGIAYSLIASGWLWDDVDGDGEEDADEPRVEGATVDLLDADGVVVRTQVTEADGQWRFRDLDAGSYLVRVAPTPDRPFTGGELDPTTGVSEPFVVADVVGLRAVFFTAGFGPVAAMRDITVDPVDGLSTGEDGTAATFEVSLSAAPIGPVVIAVASSDETEGVADVTTLEFTPEDWTALTVTVTGVDDDEVDGDAVYAVVLGTATGGGYDGVDPPDVSVINVDDDESTQTVVRGSLWREVEFDDVRGAGEGGQPDRLVRLYRTGQAAAVASTESDASGSYQFAEVEPGEYRVRVSPALDERMVTPNVGDDDTVDSDVEPDGFTEPFQVATGADIVIDGGIAAQLRVSGAVWDDLDADGVDDGAGEAAVEGVVMDLLVADGVVASTSTRVDGRWGFEGLTPGSYRVRLTAPAGRTITGVGFDATTGTTESFELADANGLRTASYNAGLTPGGDAPAVSVEPVGGLVTGEDGTAATFAVGMNVAPTALVTLSVASSDTTEGTVDVAEVAFAPDDWEAPRVVTVTGVDDPDVDGDVAYTIALAPAVGGNYDGIDPADVSAVNVDDDEVAAELTVDGWVWDDLDGDGSEEASEPRLASVGVDLLDDGGATVASTATATDGTWRFAPLEAGSYRVRIAAQAGRAFTGPDVDAVGGESELFVIADVVGLRSRTVVVGVAPAGGGGTCEPAPGQPDVDGDTYPNSCDTNNDDGPLGDLDADGLTNADEVTRGTDPQDADTDGDGATDGFEVTVGRNPLVPDALTFTADDGDRDLVADGADNCSATFNFDQTDTDGDGVGDACDGNPLDGPRADRDSDRLDNGDEAAAGTDADDADTDGDGRNDGDEERTGQDPTDADTDGDGIADGADRCPLVVDPDQPDADFDRLGDACDPSSFGWDGDGDGLSDRDEVLRHGSDPMLYDTDGDLLTDGQEVHARRTDPTNPDTDGDGAGDRLEIRPQPRANANTWDQFTDPLDPDTDRDGLADEEEWAYSFAAGQALFRPIVTPRSFDTDLDGLGDGFELALGTDPAVADVDWDGLPDGFEIAIGTDPRNNDSDADTFRDGDEAPRNGAQVSDPLDGTSWPEDDRVDLDRDRIDDRYDNCEPVPQGFFTPSYGGGNNLQDDLDQDGNGAKCDAEPGGQFATDADVDGFHTRDEVAVGLAWNVADSDGDQLFDGMERSFGSSPFRTDSDDDGLGDRDEYWGTDFRELQSFPERPDSEGDGLDDVSEALVRGTDPRSWDTDDDGLGDAVEVQQSGTDPDRSDSDDDGLPDGAEVEIFGTDPQVSDSDGDGVDDGDEADQGHDPTDPEDTPADETLVVEGLATWETQVSTIEPVRWATMTLDAGSGGDWTEITVTQIDEGGSYRFEVPAENIPAESSLRVRLIPEWQGNYEVTGTNGVPYEITFPVDPAELGGTVFNVPAFVDAGKGLAYDAVAIHSAMVAGFVWLEQIYGTDAPPVSVRYPADESAYYGATAEIFLLGPPEPDWDAYDLDVILHELGHHIAARYGYDDSPGGPHETCAPTPPDDGAPPPVMTHDELMRQAWSEGVASWWALMVGKEVPPEFVAGFEGGGDDVYQDDQFTTSLELPCPAGTAGVEDEATVFNVLWDLYDDGVDLIDPPTNRSDTLDEDPITLFTLLASAEPVTLPQFWEDYMARFPQSGGNPFVSGLDSRACLFQAAGALPEPDVPLVYGAGFPLVVADPLTVYLVDPPRPFVDGNDEVTVNIHSEFGQTWRYSHTISIGSLPIVGGQRQYRVDAASWEALINAGVLVDARVTLSLPGPSPEVRGCPRPIG